MKPSYEVLTIAVITALMLLFLWAINTRIWTECTERGMSGFYCFMQMR